MKNVLLILLIGLFLFSCAEMKKAAMGKLTMVNTTIAFSEDGESVAISSKPNAKVEITRDKDSGGITAVIVDNKEPNRPGLPERLVETLANRSTLVLGAGVDSVTQKDDD